MFTWICPKCGKEVPPSYSECPNCAKPQAVETPAEAEAAPLPEPAVVPVPPPPAPPAPARRSGGVSVPGWMLSLMIAGALIIAGLTFIVWKDSRRAPAPTQPAATALETPGTVMQSNPAFRNVELTGLRLVEDARQKPFVQVVIVNHSGADLGELDAKVNLKAVSKQEQEPVGSFALKASLGPYESKEIKAPLDTKLRVYEFPDWQFLRAEVAQ
ncbi:MAG: zinc ribbon domain-containing protein [Acidobacteriota bacterium]